MRISDWSSDVCSSDLDAQAQSSHGIGVLTGIAPAHKSIRSLRDLRFRELVQQRYDFSCGSAALASLLQYGYGMDVSEQELIKQMMVGANNSEDGRGGKGGGMTG